MVGDFDFDMRLDDNGVLLFRFSGPFDVDKWAEAQEAASARILAGEFDRSRPAVVDLRDFIPPQSDWIKIAKLVFARIGTLGKTRKRCAFITGGSRSVEISCKFYISIRKTLAGKSGDYRVFRDFDDAYGWAAGS